MNAEVQTVTIKMLGRDFKIKCPSNEIAALEEAASYVEQQIKTIRSKDSLLSNDNVAIITALNVTHEMLSQKKSAVAVPDDLKTRLQILKDKIRAAL
jgi:cell division protein ZapA